MTEHVFLPVRLCERDMKSMCGRYHFGDVGLAGLKKVYVRFLTGLNASVYYEIQKKREAAVLLTLGEPPDRAQEFLTKEGRLFEAYMIECLSMELLTAACAETDRLLHEKSGLWCGNYEFPGEQRPIEEIESLLRLLSQDEVRCNDAYALLPLKSVIYAAPLVGQAPVKSRAESMCEGCGRSDCTACNVKGRDGQNCNYGYRRIFGKDRIQKQETGTTAGSGRTFRKGDATWLKD